MQILLNIMFVLIKNVICPDTSSSLLPSEMKEISRFNTNFFLLFKNKFVEDSMKKIQLNKNCLQKVSH